MRFVEHELGSLSPVTVDSGRAKIDWGFRVVLRGHPSQSEERHRTSKSSKHSLLNYLLISRIGSNLLQKCGNWGGFSAGDATLHNPSTNTRTPTKSLIPSVLACWGPRGQTQTVLSTASEFASDFFFVEWDKMGRARVSFRVV